MGESVLITGVTGFVGRHLARTLLDAGACVYGLSRRSADDLGLAQHFLCDVTEQKKLLEIVGDTRPSYIFHLAANKARSSDINNFRACVNDNVVGAINLVESCEGASIRPKIIAIGTCEEYGDADPPYYESMRESPMNGYSCSKTAVTQILLARHRTVGLPVVVLRPTLAYGPGQSDEMFLPSLIRALLCGTRFAMSRGEQSRDFVYVDDLICAVLKAALEPACVGQIVNISSGQPTTLLDVTRMVLRVLGQDMAGLLDIGSREYRKGESMHYWADRSKSKMLMNWEPKVGLDEGVAKTIDYYRANFAA